MLKGIAPVLAGSALIAAAFAVPARGEDKPILVGINTALQLQVGRDTLDGVRMAVEEINAKGGVLGRKLEVVTADEGESPKEGVAAVNKLTGDNNVNVLIGGYDSGVTLAELPHISRAQTIFLGTGSASPAIQQKVKDDYANYKYLFRVNPINSAKQAASLMDFI
ncbi:MAG: branched-chain amino acid transport system substrate-binding protein, partial [Methylobacteriaceae bacterium]|nr:branched-chain amino acid transport system substrate-binding protein [Methylobacteriaceae bacterium]